MKNIIIYLFLLVFSFFVYKTILLYKYENEITYYYDDNSTLNESETLKIIKTPESNKRYTRHDRVVSKIIKNGYSFKESLDTISTTYTSCNCQ